MFGGTPRQLQLSPEDRTKANNVYDHWGQSLDQYEASPDVSAFSSKFDAFLAGQLHADFRRDGRLQAVQRQRQLQFMPSRRKRHHSDRRVRPTPARPPL